METDKNSTSRGGRGRRRENRQERSAGVPGRRPAPPSIALLVMEREEGVGGVWVTDSLACTDRRCGRMWRRGGGCEGGRGAG